MPRCHHPDACATRGRLRFSPGRLTLFVLLLVTWHSAAMVAGAAERPNVIVFYTDDHGYADLSCQGVLPDIRTPHVDALAASGVRAVHGYSTAPQCVPSRAGLLVGRFQARFGVEANGRSLAGFNEQTTIAQRLQAAGYVTGQFGKWHLGPTGEIPQHGFRYVYAQNSQAPFSANVTRDGTAIPMQVTRPQAYHVDACSQAAAAVIRRHRDDRLFLYIAYRAPHVPLDAPPEYLKRFPGEMPERRRQALAMLSAVDDGVGLILQTLDELKLRENTLIFYIGDNGAPLKIHKQDAPGGGPGWDGSLNDPLNGEKGMLSEGGMHTPFVVSWPARIPGGQAYQHPVSALDVAATAAVAAGLSTPAAEFDGVDLEPFLSGRIADPPHDALMWRWVSQAAIREGDWKLLRGGTREYLYNLKDDLEEQHNLISAHPAIAARLRQRLKDWSTGLNPPGLAESPQMSSTWNNYFDFYLDGKPAPPPAAMTRVKRGHRAKPSAEESPRHRNWLLRNGKLSVQSDGLRVTAGPGAKQTPFLVRNGLNLQGRVRVLVEGTWPQGSLAVAWRTDGQPDFAPGNVTRRNVDAASRVTQQELIIPAAGRVVHVRVHLPGEATIRQIELQDANGQTERLMTRGGR